MKNKIETESREIEVDGTQNRSKISITLSKSQKLIVDYPPSNGGMEQRHIKLQAPETR
jgi:hypothetical protein